MAGGGIEPRRLALRYAPPAIIVEYTRQQPYRKQLYHHEIDLQSLLPASRGTLSEYALDTLVNTITEQHEAVLEDVSTEQLRRLVRKLVANDPQEAGEVRRATVTSASAMPLPQADYNRVSESQLKQVKEKMDVAFHKNIVRPGDTGYQYDKQVAFKPAEEASDWDD
ncbi:hypothetical protein Poli38472_002427 [Pythium oligandrum]|uniref:Centrosomal protein of 19 kDa n=1 Tax=Pythium oligandrum TaxID=41045 RepID=A0A8K1CH71_PYTOL|nr:hypothetical protein Poli38472_002427 [Pythium oligandrum]|eukprot:TMW63486.1 hypothetical protein Poli38472_002427 [Pythium oligandrum]